MCLRFLHVKEAHSHLVQKKSSLGDLLMVHIDYYLSNKEKKIIWSAPGDTVGEQVGPRVS